MKKTCIWMFNNQLAYCKARTVVKDYNGIKVCPLIQPPAFQSSNRTYRNTISLLQDEMVISLHQKGWRTNDGKVVPAVWKVLDQDKLIKMAKEEEDRLGIDRTPPVVLEGKMSHLVNVMNQAIEHRECFLSFDGGRVTSTFCTMATRENEHKVEPVVLREDYLDWIWGKDNWEHWDVPSSIPQIIHILNKGFYYGKRVWDELGNNVKKYSFSIIFNNSDEKVASSILNRNREELGYKGYVSVGRDDELVGKAVSVRHRLESIVGPYQKKWGDKNSKLFIEESNIYLWVVSEALKRYGVLIYTCYDSFYWKKTDKFSVDKLKGLLEEIGSIYRDNRDFLLQEDYKAAFWDVKNYYKKPMLERRKDRHLNKDRNKDDRHLNKDRNKDRASATWKKTVRVWYKRVVHGEEVLNFEDMPTKWSEEQKQYCMEWHRQQQGR